MAGLNLYAGGYGGGRVGGGSGNYSPATPASAMSPTASIASQAYGVDGSGGDSFYDNAAWMGSVGIGILATLALAYLYWSLPR